MKNAKQHKIDRVEFILFTLIGALLGTAAIVLAMQPITQRALYGW